MRHTARIRSWCRMTYVPASLMAMPPGTLTTRVIWMMVASQSVSLRESRYDAGDGAPAVPQSGRADEHHRLAEFEAFEVSAFVPAVRVVLIHGVGRDAGGVRVEVVDDLDESGRGGQLVVGDGLPPCAVEDVRYRPARVVDGAFRILGHVFRETRGLLLPVVDDRVDPVGVVAPDDVLHDVSP